MAREVLTSLDFVLHAWQGAAVVLVKEAILKSQAGRFRSCRSPRGLFPSATSQYRGSEPLSLRGIYVGCMMCARNDWQTNREVGSRLSADERL
jgi:hypothetical protein